MAGTPTQYYGFPTYADSDAVDLTAQYNSAMINIDSELHQVELMAEAPKKKIILLGDSWTQGTWGANLVSTLSTRFNATVYNYGVSGAQLELNHPDSPSIVSSQAAQAASEHADDVIDLVLIIAGVNDFTRSDFDLTSLYSGLNLICKRLKGITKLKKTVWMPNMGINPNTNVWNNVLSVGWSYYQQPQTGTAVNTAMILGMLMHGESFYNADGLHPSDGDEYPNLVFNALMNQAYHSVAIGSGNDAVHLTAYGNGRFGKLSIMGGKNIPISFDTRLNVSKAMFLCFMLAGTMKEPLFGQVVGDGLIKVSSSAVTSTFTAQNWAAIPTMSGM